MPVKWTPDNDQMLLLKILETHDLQVNAKKIADAWPSDKGETPTPRAIQERLVKIRQNAKVNGSPHFGISAVQSKNSSTPKSSPAKTPSTSASKSKPASSGLSAETPTAKRKRENTVESTTHIKREPINDDDTVVEISHGPITPTPSRFFMQTNSPAESSFSNSFSNGGDNTTYFTGLSTPTRGSNSGRGVGGESPNKYARMGYDGASDFYGSFEDEVAV